MRSEREIEQVAKTDVAGNEHRAPLDGSIQYLAIASAAEAYIQDMFRGEASSVQRLCERAWEVFIDQKADHPSG